MDKSVLSVLIVEAPKLNDDAVANLHDFLQELMNAFESHYSHQLKRYYQRVNVHE